MADTRTEKQKVKEITDRLEEGLKELFEGEKYKSYLNTMSKFHNYSANNIQLIEMQCPDETYVAGYKAWQRNFERHVNKGERGIRILAPAPYKIKEEQEKIDPVTNEPVLDRDGMHVMEEVEIKIHIGINIHTEGTESYEDTQMDIVSGRVADLEILDYVPDITDNPKAVEVIAELIDKLPDIEVRGSLEKWQAAFLAAEIDQLSYNYDTVQYNQTVEDREAQIANITEDIRNGNTGYLDDFLNALISDSIREGMTDIFGKGTELDDSEGVQTARKAKELLDKLAEYKPLAKIEELEECNYNMIDNVLNNEKPKEEKQAGRISIKEKLAEKKAVIEQRDKSDKEAPEKGTEKKSEREI